MKKVFISIIAILSIFGLSSCSDMLDTESERQVFDPELDSKTDSLFYALGIMQAMQQLADQYHFTGEMRGDLVKTTTYTDNNLRQLANFSATTANAYDSAYVYYRVINNCNYYIAHRDTTLYTGSTNVTIAEYVGVKTFRAWAYLMLARLYGSVPFYTEPLTSISQIEESNFPEYTLTEIADVLIADLQQYSGQPVPSQATSYSVGTTNWSQSKTVNLPLCYIPVDVILGELCLEAGYYADAAQYFTKYIIDREVVATSYVSSMYVSSRDEQPSDYLSAATGTSWSSIFNANATTDIITYIPMAVNSLQGTTTAVPEAYGFDYYATSNSETTIDEIQIMPSDTYFEIADSTTYYYFRSVTGGLSQQYVGSVDLGDMRRYAILTEETEGDSTTVWVNKFKSGNIYLYRETTVWLMLAEALNRLGYPDAAFAILKEGISSRLAESTTTWITQATVSLLTNTYQFLSEANTSIFSSTDMAGIHQHGAGVTSDGAYPGRSGYQLDSEVSKKLEKIYPGGLDNLDRSDSVQFAADSLELVIDAMEDILCDEYAMEFAFEGRRFFDLCRLARHKNDSSPSVYNTSNYGGQWLAEKLQYKNPTVDLTVEDNWYLPYK